MRNATSAMNAPIYETGQPAQGKSQRFFSDWLQDYLSAHKVTTFAFNPGASFRGLHDSLVNAATARLLMTCHEEIAIAIAHGYYKASGRTIAVILHANVGLLHGSMALFNAWCDRVPLLCFVGNGPLAAGARRPWIDWIHTAHDVLAPVREYTAYSASSTDQWGTAHDIRRALRTVFTETRLGPAVVALDCSVQESLLEDRVGNLAPLELHIQKQDICPDIIREIAARLSAAHRPLIIVERAGRQPGLMKAICDLADCLKADIPVIECGYYENAISSLQRESWIRIESAKAIQTPDLVIALDVVDPVGQLGRVFDSVALQSEIFICVDTPGTPITSWSADTAIDSPGQVLQGDIIRFLSAVTMSSQPATRVAQYLDKEKPLTSETRDAMIALADLLDQRDQDFVIVNGGSTNIDQAIRATFRFNREAQFLGMNGGGGLGYGLPASLGAALAILDNGSGALAIAFLGDGDFLYTPSSLWTAAAKRIPVLLLVINNGQYMNSVEHAQIISRNRNRTTPARVATTFDEADVDFSSLAESFGIRATTVSAANMAATIEELSYAVEYVTNEQAPYLINLKVAS